MWPISSRQNLFLPQKAPLVPGSTCSTPWTKDSANKPDVFCYYYILFICVIYTILFCLLLVPLPSLDLLAIWPLVPSRVIKSLPQACPEALSRELTPFKFLYGFLKFYLWNHGELMVQFILERQYYYWMTTKLPRVQAMVQIISFPFAPPTGQPDISSDGCPGSVSLWALSFLTSAVVFRLFLFRGLTPGKRAATISGW